MVSRIKVIIIIICNIKITSSNMTGNMISGVDSKITDFPHSAYLVVGCNSKQGDGYYSCGASILNEEVLLTAGHCFIGCRANVFAFAIVGHVEHDKGKVIYVSDVKVHELYEEGCLSNDIALGLLKKSLEFSNKVSRVALMVQPPDIAEAAVAGWGKINEWSNDISNSLMSTRQTILSTATCMFTLNIPDGTFCAESNPGTGFPSSADSGSALVVRGYIQIGLVSYTNPQVSKRTTVYTNISYFYDWIIYNNKKLYCIEDTTQTQS